MKEMAAPPVSKTVTYEEWLQMPEVSEGREEVVNGEIRYMPPCKLPHVRVVELVHDELRAQLDRKLFWIPTGSFGLVIRKNPLTCREPDLAVFEEATVRVEDGYFQSAPQLVIEVISPSENRKRKEEKIRDYESIGVPECWLLGPDSRTVEVLVLENGRLRRSAILAEGILKPRALPGVEIDISKIWPD
jgi:Uma2 family endonuclease